MVVVPYSGLSVTDDAALVSNADVEPQAGDITLEVTDEEITDVRVAPIVEQPDFFSLNPLAWVAWETAEIATPSVNLLDDRVQIKTTDKPTWTYTGMTPETFTTNQMLISQEALHQHLRNPATPIDTKKDLLEATGGLIPRDTTDQDDGGGGFFDGILDALGDLFGGLGEGSGDWWKYILYAIIGIIAVVVILAVVGK